jgi:hypothetical protein
VLEPSPLRAWQHTWSRHRWPQAAVALCLRLLLRAGGVIEGKERSSSWEAVAESLAVEEDVEEGCVADFFGSAEDDAVDDHGGDGTNDGR